jgi:hypothetical protein
MLTRCFFIYRRLQFINTGLFKSNLYPEQVIVTNNHLYLESELRQTHFLAFRNEMLFSISLLASYKSINPDPSHISCTIFDIS